MQMSVMQDSRNMEAEKSAILERIIKVTPGWWVTPPRDAYDIVAEYEAKKAGGTQCRVS
jgi:hypothetical protein